MYLSSFIFWLPFHILKYGKGLLTLQSLDGRLRVHREANFLLISGGWMLHNIGSQTVGVELSIRTHLWNICLVLACPGFRLFRAHPVFRGRLRPVHPWDCRSNLRLKARSSTNTTIILLQCWIDLPGLANTIYKTLVGSN